MGKRAATTVGEMRRRGWGSDGEKLGGSEGIVGKKMEKKVGNEGKGGERR